MMASTTRSTSELKACVGEGRERTQLKKVLLKIVQASCLRSDRCFTFILINETWLFYFWRCKKEYLISSISIRNLSFVCDRMIDVPMSQRSAVVSPDDVSFTPCHCCSYFIFMRYVPTLTLFSVPVMRRNPFSLSCLVLCSTGSRMSPHLCHHLSGSCSSWLPSSSFSPPFRIVSLHIYIIMPRKICLFACALTFPFYGDSLLACGTGWSVGRPAVLAAPSFCVSIYSNRSISFPLPT